MDGKQQAEHGTENIIWMGKTVSSGRSSDLREVIDYLLVGTFRYFGQDTGKQQKIKIGSGASEVEELNKAIR